MIVYPVSPSTMPHGSSIPLGWMIVEIDGNLYYVKERKEAVQ